MAGRRALLAIVLLAAALHAIGLARAILPAQDGLKFIRIAREFQRRPWIDVVRGSDQHPLYPALVAVTEPVIAAVAGRRRVERKIRGDDIRHVVETAQRSGLAREAGIGAHRGEEPVDRDGDRNRLHARSDSDRVRAAGPHAGPAAGTTMT